MRALRWAAAAACLLLVVFVSAAGFSMVTVAPAACQAPAPNVPSGVFTQAQISALWVQVGGPRSQARIAGAVGMAESHGDPHAIGAPTQNGRALGLMQILGAVLPGDLFDPAVNMRNAVRKWRDAPGGGRNWSPWTTYTSGEYLKFMGRSGPAPAAPVVCAPVAPGQFGNATLLFEPRAYVDLPAWAMAGGRPPEQVDARILPDAEWILRTYHLAVTAARETGHHTHGDGTALDMVPVIPYSWDATALRLAHDIGWTESCAASGVAPVCPLKAWVRFVGYDGYPGHGDPGHAGANAHIHVSWYASHYGASGLVAPNRWVRVFPVPDG